MSGASDSGCDYVGGLLRGRARGASGGQNGEQGQGSDSLRPSSRRASLLFAAALLNGDRTGLGGREELTDMLEILCK